MDLRLLPDELRRAYEDAGLTAESTKNERIEQAMMSLQHAIEQDLQRLRANRETRSPGQISIRRIRL